MVDPIFGFPDFRSGSAEFAQLGPDTKRMMVTGETFNEFEALARQGIADLLAANQGDTAPTIDAPQIQGGGILGALGATLSSVVNRQAGAEYAQQQYAIRRANAQAQMQADMANQTQEGYLQRRKQEREQLAAKLQSDVQEARIKAKQAIDLYGIEAGEKRAAAALEAARKASEADAMANSKWLAEHGMSFETLFDRIKTGATEEIDPVTRQPVMRPLTMDERRSAMDTLRTIALSAPTAVMKENLDSRMSALDEYLSGIKEASKFGTRSSAGGWDDDKSVAERSGEFVRKFPGMAASAIGNPLSDTTDFIGGLLNIPEDFPGIIPPIEEFVTTKMESILGQPTNATAPSGLLGLTPRELPSLRQAREQIAPTKR